MNLDTIATYMDEIKLVYATGQSTEHSYRPALQKLFDALDEDVTAINEPRATKIGRPDFLFQRANEVEQGHCEAKNLTVDISPKSLNRGANKDQYQRYLGGFDNLIYTNGLDFHFYREAELIAQISIGDPLMGIVPKPENYPVLIEHLTDFAAVRMQSITSSAFLAKKMAGKARVLQHNLKCALEDDLKLSSELAGQYKSFRSQLIQDLSIDEFASIYAETVAYGLFAARLHDDTLNDFSRTEALELLPKSNPFLRKLFTFIAHGELEVGIRRTIDELVDYFQATDLGKLFADFGSFTQRNDPFIHFYEEFLAQYNPDKRKSRGVWYTPEPVVNFIVRAVDDVLKAEFGLQEGLADTSKVTVNWDTGQSKIKKSMHRVQILDPAAGTGTFLADVIKHIAPGIKRIAPGAWNKYVEDEILPRLHGFELLMASYAMCHMKLDMMLTELGYTPDRDSSKRFGVYLTNSLEDGQREVMDLLMAQWLTEEARLASNVKTKSPIMVVLGNPPYSGESSNKGEQFQWIAELLEAYKREPGTKSRLKERNPKWINDDYVKFIRFAEHMIDKNGEGVLGFITNHGYLDNPTFRGMRWHLLKTFDKLYVLDLHGNAKKKEVTPEGGPDKNVFDIQQGVAILIAVKTRGQNKELASLYHRDLWGTRSDKYQALETGSLGDGQWVRLEPRAPQYAFVNRDYALEEEYQKGFAITELMPVNTVGIVTARDGLTIDFDKDALWQRVLDFANIEPEEARSKYNLGSDVRDWRVEWARNDVAGNLSTDNLVSISYRPFDNRYTFFTGNSRGFLCYPRTGVMRHFLTGENVGFCISKQQKASTGFFHVIAHQNISESSLPSNRTAEIGSSFPLYLYPEENSLDQSRQVNMDPKIRRRIAKVATPRGGKEPDELAIFDYIYGVLHSPHYRQTYREFLKIDFPRIPCPVSPEQFAHCAAIGGQLRRLHLMDDEAVGEALYPFEGDGDMTVEKVEFIPVTQTTGHVKINDTMQFENVPLVAWNFYIGGYQPAQKWLKDRKSRELEIADIIHYQKIIKVLTETDRLMAEIDQIWSLPHNSGEV